MILQAALWGPCFVTARPVGALSVRACEPGMYVVNTERDGRPGRREEIETRLAELRERHAKKSTFIDRLRAAGLVGVGRTAMPGRP